MPVPLRNMFRVCLLLSLLLGARPAEAQEAVPATQPATQPVAQSPVLLGEAIDLYNRILRRQEIDVREVHTPEEAKQAVDQATADYRQMYANYQRLAMVVDQVLLAEPGNATARFLRALAAAEVARRYEVLYLTAYSWSSLAPTEKESTPAAQALKKQVAVSYRQAHDDMDVLLQGQLVDEYAIARLIDAVLQVKLARYATEASVEQARIEMLKKAEQLLQAYLSPPAGSGLSAPSGANRFWAEYALGIVYYRQAIRPEQPGVTLSTRQRVPDPARLDAAIQQLSRLDEQGEIDALLPQDMPKKEREDTARKWASFATFYVGLARFWQGSLLADARRYDAASAYYEQARQRMLQAYEYDTDGPYPLTEEKARAASRSQVLWALVPKQLDNIDQSIKGLTQWQPPEDVVDLQFDWTAGLAYDTNVPLLGDNVIAPPRFRDKDSFRVDTGFGMEYTADLGKFDKRLDRWSVAAMGRAAAGWNQDVPAYNPQDYGASAAVRYRLYDPKTSKDAFGPLYGSVQYDFDYFLLGNKDFVDVNRVFPHLTLQTFGQRGQADLGFTYEARDYHERLASHWFDRTGDYYTVGLTYSHQVWDLAPFYERHGLQPNDLRNDPDQRGYEQWRWVQPFAGVRYGWDITDGREYDADWFLFTAGISAPLPKGWILVFDGQWEWQDYNSHSKVDFHRRGRIDRIQRYGIGAQRRFVVDAGDQDTWKTMKFGRVVVIVRGDVRWIVDDSNVESWPNHAVFSYDRAIFGGSLTLQLD